MFNTIRPSDVPECTKKTGYNTTLIVELLENMFHGKCYLCEQIDLADPEIEHFDPHKGDENKKFDWFNLYYACSRCNSIKGSNHIDLLDCCNADVDVFRAIKCIVPSIPDHNITVSSTCHTGNMKATNTAKLIDECYNDQSTSLRRITRTSIMEKIFTNYYHFLELRAEIVNLRTGHQEKTCAIERLESMLSVKFPFSAFWRWHLLEDKKLLKEVEHLITF